jgi:hypothetical protein
MLERVWIGCLFVSLKLNQITEIRLSEFQWVVANQQIMPIYCITQRPLCIGTKQKGIFVKKILIWFRWRSHSEHCYTAGTWTGLPLSQTSELPSVWVMYIRCMCTTAYTARMRAEDSIYFYIYVIIIQPWLQCRCSWHTWKRGEILFHKFKDKNDKKLYLQNCITTKQTIVTVLLSTLLSSKIHI